MKVAIPLFKKSDLDASIGVFFDGFSKVIVAIAILTGTFGLNTNIIFGTMMPGILLGVFVLNGGLWLYYRKLARERNDPDLTAIPAGLQSGRIFIWLFSIMLPVYLMEGDSYLAFRVGVLAHFISGLVFLVGAFVVPFVLKIVPPGALFGSLSGGAMAFLVLQSMDGVFKMPVVGWIVLVVLFVIYLGKVNVKLPAAFIAIVIGAVIAWGMGKMPYAAVQDSFQNLSIYLPSLEVSIFHGDVIEKVVGFLPIIIAFSISEVITGIQGVEQAKECGDSYFETTKPLVIAGVASMLSALFGNPLAVGLYWGYPSWKQIKAGTGYHLIVVLLYAVIGLTGFTAIINAFIPEAAVLPILVFVGIASYAQAFDVVEKQYYPAVIMASLPIMMEFIVGKMAENALPGFVAFSQGSAFVGMLVGCLFVFIIDNAWFKAAVTNLAALILTLIGMIHSSSLILTNGYQLNVDFVMVYSILTVAFLILHVTKFNQKERKLL